MTQAPADAFAHDMTADARKTAGSVLPLLLGLIGLSCGAVVYAVYPDEQAAGSLWRPFIIGLLAAFAVGSALLLRVDRVAGEWKVLWSGLVVTGGALLYGRAAMTSAQQSVGHVFGDGNILPVLAMTAALLLGAPYLARWVDRPSSARSWKLFDQPADAIRPFWINIAMIGVALLFVLASMAILSLVSFLLHSLGFASASELIFDSALPVMVAFGAIGLAVGTLRRRAQMTDTFLRLAGTMLSLLTPVAMVIVAGFLLTLLVRLVSGAVGAMSVGTAALAAGVAAAIFLNAVFADPEASAVDGPGAGTATNRWRRWPAMVLAASILPLGIVAAVALGLRIADYGLTHERLWGIVAAVLAIAYGIACLLAVKTGFARFEAALGHHQGRWMAGAVVVLAAMALQPVDFGQVAVADQLARLADGRTKPGAFDIQALDRDMGDHGRAAVATLAKRSDTVGAAARDVVLHRRDATQAREMSAAERAAVVRANIIAKPDDVELDDALISALRGTPCAFGPCRLLRIAPDRLVLVPSPVSRHSIETIRRTSSGWSGGEGASAASEIETRHLTRDDMVTLREVTRREILVDGEPTGILVY